MIGPWLAGVLGLFPHGETFELEAETPKLYAGTPELSHPMSFSRLELHATPNGLDVDLRVQVLSLLEVTDLGLDVDANVLLSDEELRQGKPLILEYLRQGLVLVADGEALTADFRELERRHEDFDWLLVQAHIPWVKIPNACVVSSTLFFDQGNPDHRMHITLRGIRSVDQFSLLDTDNRTASFTNYPFQDYLRLGSSHVLEGWDHLAFLLALFLGVARWLGLVAAITGFTIAHSFTLALSALEIFSLSPGIVEPAIALSILVVLSLHLRGTSPRFRPWTLAFVFGLLHGFGFAGVLGEIGLPLQARTTALVGFNPGVELGQLAFALPVMLLGSLGQRLGKETRAMLRRNIFFVLGAAGLVFFANAVDAAMPTVSMAGVFAGGGLVAISLGCLPLLEKTWRPIWKQFVGSATVLFLLYELGQVLASG